jgi:large subunit ribosomal protein L23
MSTLHDILRRPIITEKSNYQAGELNKYVFEVSMNATKQMVKDAVETSFDVDVLRVNIVNVPAKRSRRWRNRRVKVRRSAYKKAIITLGSDERIDVFEGVR